MDLPGTTSAPVIGYGADPLSTGDTLATVNAASVINSTQGTAIGNGIGGSGGGAGGVNFGSLGQGVQDLFQGLGDLKEAKAYSLAATFASQEAEFAKQSTAIQQFQAGRQIYQTIGAQRAGVAGTGFQEKGSALALLRSSTQQAALTHQVIGQQGFISIAAYKEQAQAYTAMKEAANTAANGSFLGAAIGVVGAFFGL